MKIEVRPLTASPQSDWQVRLDEQAITFHSESEARAYVEQLNSRLKAPHELPESLPIT
ncbi:hypothetical protein IQ22_01693 [Pseudomonas duriflava]|uniref:Uncharacterized protein n=1 Tax=Pseudomonas duriflava TaxID=459528 RepID=A0A562QF44_9PSED|nr:hypothetical protein [Pseudomonas duriflava]TWI54790.1 hypothetical protein IQ22_01693 [Pseudomonas duriflava]